MRFRIDWVLALVCLAVVLVACGDDSDSTATAEPAAGDLPAGITVRDAWIRPATLPEGSPTPDPDHSHHDHDEHSGVLSAMYMVIENDGNQTVQLTAVETDVARVVEIHHTQNVNGLMQMRPVEAVEVPSRAEVVFEPGGYHVMLIDIQHQLEPGDEVPVTLVFGSGDRYPLPAVPVRDQ